MFVVSLTYVAPLDAVDALIPAHVEWLKSHYAAGHFVASGRKVPRTGGVILARGLSREALDAVLMNDPFALAGVARYDVTEFIPTLTATELSVIQETLP
ncbi:YciI family protein [Burkholderiaceae bacterium DAT-1]|nr:YciI family protein [Burkholderiaceae bacterium DAT-1]